MTWKNSIVHELSVCQNIISQVSKFASRHHASGVETIYLDIGPLSGVEPHLLQQAFQLACENTVAANAVLQISFVPLKARCQTCGQTSEVTMQDLTCRHCHSHQTQILNGDELLLTRLKLKTKEG